MNDIPSNPESEFSEQAMKPGDDSRPLILIVDDSPVNIMMLTEVLREDYRTGVATNGAEALKFAKKYMPDLILMDILMPQMDGYQACACLKASELTKDIPVIFITSLNEAEDKTRGFDLGVVDYITRPFETAEVRARIKTHITLERTRELLKYQNQVLEEMVDERTRQLERLLELSLLINSERDLHKIFDEIVPLVARFFSADRASLFLLDQEKRQLWTRAAEGLSKPISLPLNKGLVGRAAETGKPVIVNDASNHPDFDVSWDRKHGYCTKNVLCYPVHNRDEQLKGVLQVINKIPAGNFEAADKDLAAACAAQIGVALETYDLVTELSQAFESFAHTLVKTIEAKHPLTAGHSHRVTEYSLLLGNEIGMSDTELELLKYAGLLHDVGKIGVPDIILTKKGFFEPDERILMNKHAEWTFRILDEILMPRNLKDISKMAACHHEKMDGSGYPYSLKGEKIPYFSRIIAVGDVFDALTSRRDYPKYDQNDTFGFNPLTMEKAFNILKRDKNTHFDPEILDKALYARDGLESLWIELHAKTD